MKKSNASKSGPLIKIDYKFHFCYRTNDFFFQIIIKNRFHLYVLSMKKDLSIIVEKVVEK